MATAGNVGDEQTSQDSAGMSSDEGGNSGISELEQMLKQVTVTRFNVHPATMENLPDEILSNIFIRLLARQLGQMRSVSKSWNALLSDPSFVKSHLHHSIHNNSNQVLLVFPHNHKPFTQYSSKSLHLEPTNFINHIPTSLPMSRVIDAVNGLICLSEFDYSNIHIWNPSLSAVSIVPPPHSLPPTFDKLSSSIRFGFDPKTDDKLVKITGLRDTFNAFTSVWLPAVEIYSMRKGLWKLITQHFLYHIKKIYNTDCLCVDGHHGYLHWEIENVVKTKETILAFNLGSERFHEILLPDSILDSNHEWHRLGVLDGKLCETTWSRYGGWEVWVMEEYGVPESWVKRHVFPQFCWVRRFLYGFTSRNELFFKDEDKRLVLYDPIANKTKSTRTKHRANTFITIAEFVDSLVWI